jgi:DNA-directed RNA polymerase subunit M/transcription elongation factor TFIIS
MTPDLQVLALFICCPACGTTLEAYWAEPEDSDEVPEPALQTCGSCAEIWTADWPGFSYRMEI